MKLYLVTLVRARFDSKLKFHVEANSEQKAQTYATRQLAVKNGDFLRYTWIAEDIVQVNCPCYAYETYNGYKFWEELENETEHMRSFFLVLAPDSDRAIFVRNVSNRSDLFKYLGSIGDKVCTH